LPPLDAYTALIEAGGRRPAGYVEASRGCLHHCLHCPIPPVYGGRFFVVPPEIVLADIRGQVATGATHITFGDPDFLNGPGHSLKIVRAMHAEFPSLTFDCTAKVEHLLRRRALLPDLASLGCLFIVSAVESLSDTVLANLDKGHTRADVYAALGALRKAGIALRPSLLPFTPWSTLDDYIELLEFVAAEDLVYHVDPVQFGIRLLVPPGSALLGRATMRPFLGPSPDAAALTYTWIHPDPRMDELQARVMEIVERGAREGEETQATFLRILEAAHQAAGRPAPPSLTRLAPGPRPPRLSEPWFC
ncbi:MAG: radical SAM protein, partial [Gemmatimonadales bacterium]